VVQTELEEKEYRILREASRVRGLSIKEGLREAAREWSTNQIPFSEDPLFRPKSRRTGVRSDASKLDKQLYRERP